jgi:hypothetical protein
MVQKVLPSSMEWVSLQADVPNSTTTLAAISGLGFLVAAGFRYGFRFVVPYTSAATATGSRWVLQGPAAPTLLFGTSKYTLTATTQTVNYFSAYNIPAAANATSLLTGNMLIMEGMIQPSAAGTLQLAFASEVAASAITAKKGAWAQLFPLQPN